MKVLILGSGELGKGLVISYKRLGHYVVVCDSYLGGPATSLADESIVTDMKDEKLLSGVITGVKPDLIVPEIEAINIESLKNAEKNGTRVIPNAKTVEICMDRAKLKNLAKELDVIAADFKVFDKNQKEECRIFVDSQFNTHVSSFKMVVKPLMSSSGKGQSIISNTLEIDKAWDCAEKGSRGEFKGVIVERFIQFHGEITFLAVRNDFETVILEPIFQEQVDGDFRESWTCWNENKTFFSSAKTKINKFLESFGGRGVFGFEFFHTHSGLIFNEVSPRPHDTGMITELSERFSEFDLHVRASLNYRIERLHGSKTKCFASRALLFKGPGGTYEIVEIMGIENALNICEDIRIFGKKTIGDVPRRIGVVYACGETIEEARKKCRYAAQCVKIKPHKKDNLDEQKLLECII